jgi:hypothetical protein
MLDRDANSRPRLPIPLPTDGPLGDARLSSSGDRRSNRLGQRAKDIRAGSAYIRLVSGPLRQIVAFGGGGFSMEAGNPLLDDYVLGLPRKPRPKVCFMPSASGDADHYIVRFYRAFDASRCEPSHVSLFRREAGAPDLRTHLLEQDII